MIDKGLDERFANVPSISSVFAGNDCAFGRDVTFCFYGELCRLGAKHFSCTSVLRRRFDDCFQIFILGLLDSNSLERFPSCDMAAWEKLANGKGKEKEERHLSYANPSEPSADILRGLSVPLALKKREEYDHAGAAYISRNLWVFFQTLKEVSKAVDGDSGKFGAVVAKLTVTSNHLLHKFSGSLWPVSLEMEYHRRRQLLKGILAECLHLDLTEFLFNILRELIAHLLYILDGAAVIADERTSFQDGSSSALTHKQAKLHFLQNLQAEFVAEFFSLLWLKNTKYGEHDKNRQLGKKMIDFISLLCERDSTGQTMESFRGHLSKLLGTSFPETNSKLEHKLKVDLLLCICKRAPRLFLSSVAHEKMMDNILSTLCSSHLKIDDQERSHSLGAFTDALSVPRRAGRLFLPSSNCSTILGHHLGVLMSEEVAYALRSRSAQGRIQEARCCALGKIFPRKLGNNQLSFKSREIIVQLTGRLMKAHNDEIRSDSLCHLLDTKDLATLLQNIVRCIIDSFKTLTEDELSIFLCSAFEGISLLLQTQVDGDDRRSFIECIRRDSRDISSSEVEVINIENKDKLIYFRVWVDSLLMRKLCIALTTLENLEEDISLLFSEWPEVESLPPVTRSSSFRVLLQTREFLLRIKKHRQNVYAQRKSLSVRNSSDLLGWKPESPVIRAAKKVLATVDAIP